MRSLVLVPYCPLPLDTGAKIEMWKHLVILKELGSCRVVSARRRPVGSGWNADFQHQLLSLGFELVFREDAIQITKKQVLGYIYGLVCKGFGLARAFGHSNPYHRYAFPKNWWYDLTKQADLAIINYSYWAHLPCACPKVVILHDLISNFSWENFSYETRELQSADLVISISHDEKKMLHQRGVSKTLWSPPLVAHADLPMKEAVGLVGSGNAFNVEGLRWLEKGLSKQKISIRVYGDLARHVCSKMMTPVGRYQDSLQPYRDCGIIVLPTAGGTGVQIKAVEALAAGRIIVARKGAMRGLPSEGGAWVEVEKPEEMVSWVQRLQADSFKRRELAGAARTYYERYLKSSMIEQGLEEAYRSMVR